MWDSIFTYKLEVCCIEAPIQRRRKEENIKRNKLESNLLFVVVFVVVFLVVFVVVIVVVFVFVFAVVFVVVIFFAIIIICPSLEKG